MNSLAEIADLRAHLVALPVDAPTERVDTRVESRAECVDATQAGIERGRQYAERRGHEADQAPGDRRHEAIVLPSAGAASRPAESVDDRASSDLARRTARAL